MTNSQLIERYVRQLERTGKSAKTIKSYVDTIVKHTSKSYFDVNGFDIEDFVDSLSKNSATTINQRISALKSFYGYLEDMGVIKNSPTNTLKLIAVKEKQKKWELIPIEEYKSIVTDKKIDEPVRVAIALSAFAGLRTEEICNLKVANVSVSSNTITVVEGKGGKTATVPMSDYLKDLLVPYIQKCTSEYMVVNKQGGKMSTTNLQQRFATLKKKRGLSQDLHIHSGRHTLATHLLNNGAPIMVVRDVMRHSSSTTTEKIYYHSSERTNLEAINKLF